MCRAFVKRIFGNDEENDNEWFTLPMLSALAHINEFHLKLKRFSADRSSFDTFHEFKGGEVERVLLHTMAGPPGEFYCERDPLRSNLNHFNLLNEKPSVFRSPEIVWKDMEEHDRSSSNNTGESMGGGAVTSLGELLTWRARNSSDHCQL